MSRLIHHVVLAALVSILALVHIACAASSLSSNVPSSTHAPSTNSAVETERPLAAIKAADKAAEQDNWSEHTVPAPVVRVVEEPRHIDTPGPESPRSSPSRRRVPRCAEHGVRPTRNALPEDTSGRALRVAGSRVIGSRHDHSTRCPSDARGR